MIGDNFKGKTRILNVFNNNNFEINVYPTNDIYSIQTIIKIINQSINIILIDIPSKWIYRKIILNYD